MRKLHYLGISYWLYVHEDRIKFYNKDAKNKEKTVNFRYKCKRGKYTNTKQIDAEIYSCHSQMILKNWLSHEQENTHRTPEKLVSYIGIDHLVRVSKTMMTGTSVCFTMESLWNSYPLLASWEYFQKLLFDIKLFHFHFSKKSMKTMLTAARFVCYFVSDIGCSCCTFPFFFHPHTPNFETIILGTLPLPIGWYMLLIIRGLIVSTSFWISHVTLCKISDLIIPVSDAFW